MTNDSKIALGISAFILCLVIGWAWPFMWLLLIGGLVVLFALPTKQTPAQLRAAQATAAVEPVATLQSNQQIDQISQAIEAAARSEQNDDVRQGLQRALAIVRQVVPVASGEVPVNTSIRSLVQPKISEADRLRQRQAQELRNVNVILYTASFLLVGAAITFIGVSEGVGETAKFVLLSLVAVGFYVAGLGLHASSTRLRPAATAFVGTGLALIPFVGLTLYWFVLPNASFVWWLTSLVGLAALVGAVARIRSNVMIYLLLAFVFSLSASSVAVLQAPLVWYFVAVMVAGSGMTLLATRRPEWAGEGFRQPLERNAQLSVPLALVGALLASNSFGAWEYTAISGVAALHYLVNAFGVSDTKTRLAYWNAARALLIVFAATFAYAATSDWKTTFFALLLAGIVSHAYAIRHTGRSHERAWLVISQALVASSLFVWYDDMTVVGVILGIIVLLSAHQLFVVKRFEHAVLGLFSAIMLPLVVGFGIVTPPLASEYVAAAVLTIAWILLGARAVLAGRHLTFRLTMSAGYTLFFIEALAVVSVSGDVAWGAGIFILTGLGALLATFVERQPWAAIAANLLFAVGVAQMYDVLLMEDVWRPVATGLTLAGVWYGLRWYLVQPGVVNFANITRSNIMMVSAVLVLALTALVGMFGPTEGVVVSTLLGCLAAGLLVIEGNVRGARYMYEIALYVATFCLQRLVGFTTPDTHILVYTHWWALAGGLAALIHYGRSGEQSGSQARAVLSLLMLSLPTGLFALFDPTGFQWLFLAEQVALIVIGALLNNKLFTVWGAVGVGLAMLYMLKGYTYLLLTLIAVGLIGLAIWRLMRSK